MPGVMPVAANFEAIHVNLFKRMQLLKDKEEELRKYDRDGNLGISEHSSWLSRERRRAYADRGRCHLLTE